MKKWDVTEGMAVSILGEARISIIEMIRPNQIQHLNEIMVLKIVTSIITG